MSSCAKCMEHLSSKNECPNTGLLCQRCWESWQLEEEKENERDHCRHCGCSTPSCHKVCDRCLRFDMVKQEVMEKYSGVFESLAKIEAQELNQEFSKRIVQLEEQVEKLNFQIDDLEGFIYNLENMNTKLEQANDVLLTKNKQLEEQLTRQTNEMNDLRKLLSVGG